MYPFDEGWLAKLSELRASGVDPYPTGLHVTHTAAQLADLADHLDLDGNLLIDNDPFEGVRAQGGLLSFAGTQERHGLQVRPRQQL